MGWGRGGTVEGGRSTTPLSLPGRDLLPAIRPAGRPAAGSMKLSMRSPKRTMRWPPDMRAPASVRAHALAVRVCQTSAGGQRRQRASAVGESPNHTMA